MSFQQLSVEKLKDYDIILGADICFWDEMSAALYNLINRAKKAGVKLSDVSKPKDAAQAVGILRALDIAVSDDIRVLL